MKAIGLLLIVEALELLRLSLTLPVSPCQGPRASLALARSEARSHCDGEGNPGPSRSFKPATQAGTGSSLQSRVHRRPTASGRPGPVTGASATGSGVTAA